MGGSPSLGLVWGAGSWGGQRCRAGGDGGGQQPGPRAWSGAPGWGWGTRGAGWGTGGGVSLAGALRAHPQVGGCSGGGGGVGGKAPSNPTLPCCRYKPLSGMAGAQGLWPARGGSGTGRAGGLALVQYWELGGRAGSPGVVRALWRGWAPAEAFGLFLFSYKQDRTQSSINLKNKKEQEEEWGTAGGSTRPPRPCSGPPPQ